MFICIACLLLKTASVRRLVRISCKKFVLLYLILKERAELPPFCDTSVVEMEHVSKYCSECSILSDIFWISGDWKKQVTSSRPCCFCSSGVYLFCRNACRLHWGNIIVLIYKIQSLKLMLIYLTNEEKESSESLKYYSSWLSCAFQISWCLLHWKVNAINTSLFAPLMQELFSFSSISEQSLHYSLTSLYRCLAHLYSSHTSDYNPFVLAWVGLVLWLKFCLI